MASESPNITEKLTTELARSFILAQRLADVRARDRTTMMNKPTSDTTQEPTDQDSDLFNIASGDVHDVSLADDEAIARALATIDGSENTKSIPEKRSSAKIPTMNLVEARRESFEDIVLRLTNEFSPVIEPYWDTLVYIGPPPQEHGQDDDEYKYIRHHFSKPYLMNSKTLRDTGSAHFAKLLGPMSARAQRKLKKIGAHHNLPGDRSPSYFIDLRPPQDDDDAVLMITELECTNGILTWHKTAREYGIDKTVVLGKDRLNTTRSKKENPAPEEVPMSSAAAKHVASTAKALNDDIEASYSALRHHMAIERLLHTISGGDPRLNSAPKVWNYFAIAKYLDCLSAPAVKSEIFSWLFAGRNSNFIQYNTEISYRMALGLKAQDLTRVTFAALVGNQAWLQTFREQSLPKSLSKQPASFLKYLDDDEINRIDHAAQSLLYKVRSTFDKIANRPMSWMVKSTEMLKLLALQGYNEDAAAAIERTQAQLVALIRVEIYRALSHNWTRSQLETGGNQISHDVFSGQNIGLEAYNKLSLPQRLMTLAFWTNFKTYGFYQETAVLRAWHSNHSLDGGETLAPDLYVLFSAGNKTTIAKETVASSIDQVNEFIFRRAAGYWKHETRTDRSLHSDTMILWSDIVVAASHNVATKAKSDPHWHFADIENANLLPSKSNLSEQGQELNRVMEQLKLNTSEREQAKSLSTDLISKSDLHDNLPETMLLTRDAPSRWRNPLNPVSSRGMDRTSNHISKALLFSELSVQLRKVIESEILTPGWAKDEIGVENEIPIDQIDTLLCLNDAQWKFLPLWAGGCDDGTGGVFLEQHVPDMGEQEGFQGGKRGLGKDEGLDGLEDIEMGEGGAYSIIDGSNSEFDDIKTEEALSTVGRASHLATDGTRSSAATVMSLDE